MAKTEEKEKVRGLRKTGLSLKEIAEITGNNKSSISYWCKNILLSEQQLKKLGERRKTAGLKALLAYTENKRKDRLLRTEAAAVKGEKEVGLLGKRDMFITGLALYWGEGYKKGNDELGFTNSDPRIIKFILMWFREIYLLHNKDFILRVSINSTHKKRERAIVSFWSKTTRVSTDQFTKSSIIVSSPKKIYKNSDSYFGTLRVKVRRGTELRRRIMGSLKALADYAEKNT